MGTIACNLVVSIELRSTGCTLIGPLHGDLRLGIKDNSLLPSSFNVSLGNRLPQRYSRAATALVRQSLPAQCVTVFKALLYEARQRLAHRERVSSASMRRRRYGSTPHLISEYTCHVIWPRTATPCVSAKCIWLASSKAIPLIGFRDLNGQNQKPKLLSL